MQYNYKGAPIDLNELARGYSGAKVYHFEAEDKTYSLKILPGDFDQEQSERVAEICKLYRDLGIRSLDLVKSGKVETTGQQFYVYNYIPGDNFENVGKIYSKEENYRVGRQLGDWLYILKYATPSSKLAEYRKDTDAMINDAASKYQHFLDNSEAIRIAKQYYNIQTIQDFGKKLADYVGLFDDREHLIHGDIKRSNTIIDPEGKIWLIDIESMHMSHDIMNFHYQMTWYLSAGDKKKIAFMRGVFDGLYKDSYPPRDFQRQAKCVTLLNFCEYVVKHQDDHEELSNYLERVQGIFPKILEAEDVLDI